MAEWLEIDGLGGFASGTVAGPRTRRYHALLLVATTPPTGRFVLVNVRDRTLGPAPEIRGDGQAAAGRIVHPARGGPRPCEPGMQSLLKGDAGLHAPDGAWNICRSALREIPPNVTATPVLDFPQSFPKPI